MPIYSKLNNT